MLTWVLYIRDCINMVNWEIQKTKGMIPRGSSHHKMLNSAIKHHLEKFENTGHKYLKLTRPLFQQALSILARLGFPYEGCKTPPFQVSFALSGAIGGLQEDNVKPEAMWFVDDEHFMRHIKRCGAELVTTIGVAKESKYSEELATDELDAYGSSEEARSLLSMGTNIMPKDLGRF
jgi:hypothetical protein